MHNACPFLRPIVHETPSLITVDYFMHSAPCCISRTTWLRSSTWLRTPRPRCLRCALLISACTVSWDIVYFVRMFFEPSQLCSFTCRRTDAREAMQSKTRAMFANAASKKLKAETIEKEFAEIKKVSNDGMRRTSPITCPSLPHRSRSGSWALPMKR